MASANIYGACIAFLVGDSGDIRTTVNAEQSALLAAGSVFEVRPARQVNALPLCVEVSLFGEADRVVGIGWSERDVTLDMTVCLRQKDPTGATQTAVLQSVTRALASRYRNVSNLAITVSDPSGNLATFVRSSATVQAVDSDQEAVELASVVVRVTFTFLEPDADNS